MFENMDTADPGLGDTTVAALADYFEEATEFEQLLTQLLDAGVADDDRMRADVRAQVILERYQEQPHLLDRHLEGYFGRLVGAVRSRYFVQQAQQRGQQRDTFNSVMTLLYFLAKVRGPKVIVKFFSHDVTDVEPLLAMLQRQGRDAVAVWMTRYVLLLWLSIVCMIPFDFDKIDTNGRLLASLVDEAKWYIGVFGKEREAAVLLLARLFVRRDVLEPHLATFIDWAMDEFDTKNPLLV